MSSWDSVQRTKATLAYSVHDQTLVRRVGKVCKGVDNRSDLGNLKSIGEHERRVEGLASIVAGATCAGNRSLVHNGSSGKRARRYGNGSLSRSGARPFNTMSIGSVAFWIRCQ